MSLNVCALVGRLTRDPDLKYLANGTAVVNSSLALNEVWNSKDGKRQEKVTFIEFQLFGKSAEVFKKHLFKGREVGIVGKLNSDSWEKDGVERTKYFIRALEWNFVADGRRSKEPAEPTSPPVDDDDIPPEVGDDEELPF